MTISATSSLTPTQQPSTPTARPAAQNQPTDSVHLSAAATQHLKGAGGDADGDGDGH